MSRSSSGDSSSFQRFRSLIRTIESQNEVQSMSSQPSFVSEDGEYQWDTPMVSHSFNRPRSPTCRKCTHSSSRKTKDSARTDVSSEMEYALLYKVEDDIQALENVIIQIEASLGQQMSKNPWERLYLHNNKGVQEHLEELYSTVNQLLWMRDDIISGQFRIAVQRNLQDERKISQDEVFHRLYKNQPKVSASMTSHRPPPRAASAGVHAKTSNSSSNGRQRAHWHDRLYLKGIASIRQKEETAKKAQLEREQKELVEYAQGRLQARLNAKDYLKEFCGQKKSTDMEADRETQEALQKIRDSPANVRKFIERKKLTKEEEGRIFSVLHKRGYKTKEELEAYRIEREARGCTFHPEINKASAKIASEGGRDILKEVEKWREKQRCTYQKALERKRVAILNAKMEEDHHFRKRVEMDSSVGERFKRNLCV